jgi:hypothetical protein
MARTHRFGMLLTLGVLLASACGSGSAGGQPPAMAQVAPPGGEHAITFVFANEMGTAFRLERIDVGLDGRQLYLKAAATGLAEEREIQLARDLPLPAGEHVVDLELIFRGNGEGVFSYLKGYTFKVRSRHVFQARPGLVIGIHARERTGGPLEQRPHVQFEETQRQDR